MLLEEIHGDLMSIKKYETLTEDVNVHNVT